MAQFLPFDPNVEVSGTVIQSIVKAMGDRALLVLAAHGIAGIDPNSWYPQQAWLDSFRDLAQGDFSSTLDLVSIGMRIAEDTVWSPDTKTVEEALFSINDAYQMAHRNGKIGSYDVEMVGENEAKLVCRNPYPCDFDYGLIYSAARLFLPPRSGLSVIHDDHTYCRKRGDDFCTYYVHW